MTTTENTTTAQLAQAMAAVETAKAARAADRCWPNTAAMLKAQQELEDLLAEDVKAYAEMWTAVAGTSDAALVENLILASIEEA